MRKVLLFIGLLICAFTSFAQVDNKTKNAALQLVRQNAAAIKLPSQDINDVIVSSSYQITGTDVIMVYLQQSYKGIPVYNQLKTLAFRGGKVVSDAGDLQPSMEKLTGNASNLPGISPANALQSAFREAKVEATELAVPISVLEDGRKFEFGKLGVSAENISAELIWMPNARGEYRLAWQVFVAPVSTSDYWLIRVDAQTGTILNKDNLTITCKWDHENHSIEKHVAEKHNKKSATSSMNYVMQRNDKSNKWEYKPFVIGTATYRVVKYPAESPQHPGGTPSLHTDPWTLTPGNATSLKWHSDPADYNITRGNNVWAQEDRDANNTTFGITGNSTTPLPNLTFDYTYDFTKSPIDPTSDNQQAAIVNLFYMNNLMHDMAYTYGFDEVAGNFQNDNQGRGGAGVDYVIADAQDASGTNNANFATPADGSRPRMQMFLWTAPNPDRDGDLDNGIVSHEYGHGISNRFTGGPNVVNCLQNAEQGGEGWSDYMSLMMGTNWATATINDGPIRRGIGTYALNQPITGNGIRAQPYSTDMSIFSLTYANLPGQAVPHGVGTIWCGMLWEMTWEIIKQDNFIEPNFMSPPGAVSTWRGNAAAMKLVMEGMRLQPCSPGFVQSRNAILQADQVFFGGRYACSIWKAFAKRGLGRNASQGSNTSISDGVPDFSVDSGNFGLNPSGPSVFEGTPLTYTNVVSAGECTPMANYVLRDTLPTTVTWVSGGVYTPGDRVVTFSPINLAINTSQNFPVTVNVNAGTYFAPVEHINDPVTAIAPNWTATSTTANVWATSGASVRSAPLAFFSPNPTVSSQQILTTTNPIVLTANPSAFTSLSFWHRYVTESGFDGCVVEISTNSGGTWTDLGPYMSGARYNGTLSALNTFLGGRQAFTGNVGASFVETKINLAAFAGQTILIRFRFASDPSVGATGWYIDDILLESKPFVYTKAGLYDNTNTRVSYKDSLTPIIQALCADPPVVNAPTVTQPTCGGTLTGTIVVNATGVSTLEYSINGGTTYQASNTFTGLAAGNYDIVVRLQATPSCVTTYSSNPVVINALTGTPSITPPTVTQPLCPILTGTIVVNATGTGTLEYSVNGGTTFQLSNTFSGLTPGNYNIVVREQSNPGCSTIYSGNPVVINTVIPPVVVTQPVNRIICQNGNTTFTITDNAPVPAPTYQWQISTNGGTTWTNLANVAPFSGVTTTTLTVTSAGLVYNGNLFRCVVQNICGPTNSNSASLTVNPIPTVNSGPSGLCAPVTLTASGNADTYAWTPSGGLNTTTGTTVIATPTVTTVYTVTGTITATGCQNSASVTVLGTPATPAITPAAPVICAGTIQPLTVAPTTFTVTYSGAALTIPGTGTGAGTGAPASVYPAVVNISGLPTSGVRVKSIAINGLTHTFPGDIDMVVQSPTGTNVVIMSDAGGGTDIVNSNLVFDDAAASLLPAAIVSGTYRPTNAAGPDAFPAPGPGSITQVNPPLSNFTGNFNGNWNLFVVDDAGGDAGSLTSWTITFEVPTAIWSPATGLFSDPAATVPYVAGTAASTVYFLQSPAVTTNYTYTVTNTLGTCSSGPASVTVTVNPVPTIAVGPNNQCGPVTLTATGNSNSYSWSPAAGLNTTTGAVVIANPTANTVYTVTGALTPSGCTSSASVTVNATPPAPVVTPSSVSLCLGNIAPLSVPVTFNSANGGAITINASGAGTPYPSTINVTGVPAGARVKSVRINGFAHTFPDDVDILLQSPASTNVVIMSDVGGSADNTGQNFVFDDAAGSLMSDGALNASGTYRPTNYVTPDTWAAPGPGAITQAVPTLSSFTGNMNGTWNLFVVDDLGGDGGAIASWSITFEVPGPVWSPATGLFTNAAATIPYVAGTQLATVYASPATTTTYSVNNITPTCTSPTTTVTVTIYQPIAITTQPASQTVCAGATVTFSVATTGNFQTYQWQLSTDNGATWTNISGANATSYVVANTTTALSGRRYRVIVTNSCNTVTSNAATLTVNALPTVVANDLFSRRICISDTLVPLIGTPVGGSWSGIGVSGFNFIPGATAVGTYTLTYSYTNAAGCTSTDTTTVKVSDCPERIRLLRDNAVILFPNPNNGQFNIRMNSVLYNYLGMKVYTAAGQLVHTQQWSGLVYGRVIPINLTHLPAAVYMVRFVYDDGIRTSEKTFKVIVGRQ
ncbi:MAG: M36 family metallopeptidase [Chitinophagaceae bacterium]|nr:M36 family metallopeptidase [Chitinophagaceae bacterium]